LAREFQQAIFSVGVRFNPSVTENVSDAHAAFDEAATDEQAAMTFKRFVLRAHDRKTASRCDIFDPIEPSDKERAHGHLLVIGWHTKFGAAPEFDTHEDVRNSCGVKPGFDSGVTEMRETGRR
jgi:hypothetical protein